MIMKDEQHHETSDSEPEKPKPLKSVRRHCLDCCNGSSNEVSLCPAKACPLWPFRLGRGPTSEPLAEVADVDIYPLEAEQTGADVAGRSALKSIKARCIDCSGASRSEANNCDLTSCDLHPFREGKSGRIISPEMRASLVARLAHHRQ